ncbi:MAG: O-antigen ligase family protein [Oscillospiraceae bacterium]|nr:O-antigen ligase family protein [Oscillospiraceae bacterium]
MLRILKASFFYMLLDSCLVKLTESVQKSAIVRTLGRVFAQIRRWAKDSAIVQFCTWIADGIGSSVRNSAILARFLKEDEVGRFRERGVIYRGYLAVLGFLRQIYHAQRLDKLFGSSLLLKPWIWASLAMIALPLLPTMAVLGLVILSMLSLIATLCHDRERNLTYTAVNKYVWFYALAYGLATIVSVTPRESLDVGLITVCFVLFFQVLLSSIETKRQVRGILYLLAGVGAVVSVYGFYQFIFSTTAGGAWLDRGMFDFGVRVYSTFGNPNVLGEYFLLIIPLIFGALLITKSRPGRLYFFGTAVLMCICLVLTYSRGSYLGIAIAAAVFLVLLDRRFILPGILFAALLFLALPATIIDRFLSIGDLGDTSTSFRVFIWMGTLAMLRDYWFSGIGPGEAAWAMVYPAYAFSAIVTPHSHNLFLQITSDAGAPGLLVFLGVLYQYFKATFAAIRRKIQGEQRILVIASIASVVGFLVQSMTDYTFYNYRLMLFFWAVLALGLIAVRYDKLKEGGEGP